MATVTHEPPQTSSRAMGESRVLLPNISWALFQEIADARGDRLPRLTYVDGALELMSPSYRHDDLAFKIGVFVMMVARGLDRTCRGAGSTRWERAGLEVSKEPDGCFYLENEPIIRGLRDVDLAIHPPPDLAIEVEISRPLRDALRVYAALGVPEVWRFDGHTLQFLHLEEGVYHRRAVSRAFPMLGEEEAVAKLILGDTMEQGAWSQDVETWARRELRARC
jgi:Uma2 family endonuclease